MIWLYTLKAQEIYFKKCKHSSTGLYSVPPKLQLEPVNVTLFGNKVCADVMN